jgi:hypothetical protein
LKLLHTPVTDALEGTVGTWAGAAVLAFALIFGIVFIAGKLIAWKVGGATRKSVIGPVDRLLGGGFGALKGLIIATLLYLAANLVYDIWAGRQAPRPAWMADSRTYPLLNASGPRDCRFRRVAPRPGASGGRCRQQPREREPERAVIRLHDTMAREKRVFAPVDPARVTMYVCGPTVYNRAHIGNARPAVVFDVLARLLRHRYGADKLVYARNVTDVDDKIIQSAADEGVDPAVITARYEQHYLDDMGALGVAPPDIAPHATEHVPDMIAMIARLIETGNAYPADGHVLFHVPSDPGYGALGRRDRDATIAGARVEVAAYKKDPADFVLWKPSPDGVIGWDSPWGRGRPGWHIECSAMIERHLGETIDIHAGGLDLIFPHHENELAQSRCAHAGAPLARYWVHNGFSRWPAPRRCRRASATS